ncbi:MAG: phage portal protein [Clostridiales bacterium]|nr:phage portal protein [Clostridiales bacterium]
MNSAVISFLKSKKISVIEEDVSTKLDVWAQWYKGKVDGFHNYKVYQGKKKVNRNRLSLNMPSRVCQDWADLLLNERVEVSCSDKPTQEAIERLLKQVNFYVRGNNLIERAFALGGGFFIQYYDGEKTNQKYISQEFMYPITYDSGRLVECAFASSKTIGGKRYTYIETHLKDEHGFYVIDNFLCQEHKNQLIEVSETFYNEHKLAQTVNTQSTKPLFQQVRPNIANKDNFDSPFGTSVFSGAIDCFRATDLVFDAYFKEFKLGQKRIFVKDGVTTLNFDENGNEIRVFDPQDEVFYSMPDSEDSEPIHESNMELRIASFDQGLQTQLNLISQNCGFGANGYKWENGNVSTATQIVSENSKMFRTLKKHELLLEDTIINMVRGLLTVERVFAKTKGINEDAEITVNFDDSIIEDTAEIKRQATSELNLSLISKQEYYRKVDKLGDKEAKRRAKKMTKELIEEQEMLGVGEEPKPEGNEED